MVSFGTVNKGVSIAFKLRVLTKIYRINGVIIIINRDADKRIVINLIFLYVTNKYIEKNNKNNGIINNAVPYANKDNPKQKNAIGKYFCLLNEKTKKKLLIKKAEGKMFESRPQRDNMICQGDIVNKNVETNAISLFSISFTKKKKIIRDTNPKIKLVSLIENTLRPNKRIAGIDK